MKILRALILSAVTLVALGGPSFTCSTAQAQHSHARTSSVRIYYVYVRSSPRHAWQFYGGYYNASQAAYVAYYFRYYGYDAFYR